MTSQDDLLAYLRTQNAPRSTIEIVKHFAPNIEPWDITAARSSVYGRLAAMTRRGLVRHRAVLGRTGIEARWEAVA